MKKVKINLLALGLLATVLTTSTTSVFAATKTSTSNATTTVSNTTINKGSSIKLASVSYDYWSGIHEYGITTAAVNVRTDPGTNYPISTSLRAGTQITVDGDSWDGEWDHVCDPVDGFINKAYVRSDD